MPYLDLWISAGFLATKLVAGEGQDTYTLPQTIIDTGNSKQTNDDVSVAEISNRIRSNPLSYVGS